MAINAPLTLDEILISLADNWWSIHRDRKWEMDELELVLHNYPERQQEFDAAYKAFESHPYWPFVQLVCQKSGLVAYRLRDAVCKKFDGSREIVEALDDLDVKGTTAWLVGKLYEGWPDVAEGLFGPKAINSTAHGSTEAGFSEHESAGSDRSEEFGGCSEKDKSPSGNDATGFLGGAALADKLGIDVSRRGPFFKRLERLRDDLGDRNWHEVRDPRRNSPQYIYRADSPMLLEVAADYKKPKRA